MGEEGLMAVGKDASAVGEAVKGWEAKGNCCLILWSVIAGPSGGRRGVIMVEVFVGGVVGLSGRESMIRRGRLGWTCRL